MIVNNLIRIIRKNRLDFIINLAGISVAMLICLFIFLYVKNEVTFDKYHANSDRIFRITTSLTAPTGENTNMALANPPFAHILKDRCPEIEEYACVEVEDRVTLEYEKSEFENVLLRAATPSIFKVFTYSAILGNSSEFLKSPNTIVLTQTISDKIFGKQSPLGQKITLNKKDYEVSGVIEDLPTNTDLQFSALIPSDFDGSGDLFDWGDYFVYLKTTNPDISGLNGKIEEITAEEYGEFLKQMEGFQLVHHLQPLTSIHFDNSKLADTPKGNKTMVYVFSVIALLILLIAGINYNNLTLAQIEKRAKEFSIRKTIGASKQRIVFKVIGESLANIVLASVVAVVLSVLLFPLFNKLFETDFQFSSILPVAFPLLTIFLLFGVVSSLYPSIKTAGKSFSQKQGFGLLGKSLVTFQNVVAITMIAGLFLVWNQVRFMKNAELGFNKNQLMAISIPPESETFPGKEALRQEFSALPEIKSLAFGGGGTILGNTSNWMKAIMAIEDDEGNSVQFVLNQPQIDENYIDLFGIELLEGRNFSTAISGDIDKSAIINESYARIMGWDDPIGKVLDETPPQTIIGVIKDFNFDALNNPIEPLKFTMLNEQPAYLFVRAEPKDLPVIEKQWKKLYPNEPFSFQYMDEHMASLYWKQEKDMATFSFLTLVAIIISCMGLYGLTSHFCYNRTKEIGIRKVNGAKVVEIHSMLNKDFVKWVVIAFVIATPLAYFAMNKWLENFAFKTTLSWWIFALAGLLALGIALLTVSWQSWKAATRNPVEALRYE